MCKAAYPMKNVLVFSNNHGNNNTNCNIDNNYPTTHKGLDPNLSKVMSLDKSYT